MGFGSIIAAIISVATILLACYVCSEGGFYMANGLSDSVIEMQENKNEILKTGIEVRSVSTDGVDLLVSLQNTGSTKIGDFTYMDIIVTYQNESGITRLSGFLIRKMRPIPKTDGKKLILCRT